MTSARALIGLPVLLDGKPMGRAVGIGLDGGLRKLEGVYADCGLKGVRLIRAIRLLGAVSVQAADAGKRAKLKGIPVRRVVTEDGARYGAVTGYLIEPRTLRIEALEVSRGFFEDFLEGREWLFRYAVRDPQGDVLRMDGEGGEGQ